MAEAPTGTVTFLYTDLEGSTARWERQPQAMRAAVARHDALLRAAIAAHHGHVFRTVGDGLCAAFAVAPDAVAAALAAQRALHAEPWGEIGPLRARIALHTGAAEVQGGDYVGACLNRVGRLLPVGHGGQIILSGAVQPLVRDALPTASSLADLGEHRLRDLVQPERVFQLLHPDLPADFPPLRSLDAFPHNLPLQLTSFVGREREMAEVRRRLGATRLLTLTGAGGCGKTRLALQIAADLVDQFPDGVWLVELAPLADPALVPQAVAGTLGIGEQPGRPLLTTLSEALRPTRLLLLLDNCEHLLDACAQLVETLLHTCPAVRILATSRELLGVSGEATWRVPSLATPDPDHLPPLADLAQVEAVRLFVERARLLRPTFALTEATAPALAQVCRRLDGIPLALELAAARIRALPVDQLAARLDDRFRLLTGGSRMALPRQQTLRATLDWSYGLLEEPETALLRRLAVFAGGWTLEAVEAVCGFEPLEGEAVLDLLTRLVDQSLAQIDEDSDGEGRYRLLETVRQYAAERLLEVGEGTAVRGRHAAHFVALAERAEPALFGPEQLAWFGRLEVEHDNLRAALAWCRDTEPPVGLRLAGNLWRFWQLRAYQHEGRDWLEHLLARAPGRTVDRARASLGAGILARTDSELGAARRYHDEGLSVSRETGERRLITWHLHDLSIVMFWLGDLHAARALAEERLALVRAGGEHDRLGPDPIMLGMVLAAQGEYDRARALLEESLTLRRATGERQRIATALEGLGWVASAQGDGAHATAVLEEALALAQAMRMPAMTARIQAELGDAAYRRGELGGAVAHYEAGLSLAREAHSTESIPATLAGLGRAVGLQGDAARATSLLQESLTRATALGMRQLMGRTLWGLGLVAWRAGDARQATRLLRDSLALRREMGARSGIAECLEGLAAVAAGEAHAERAARLLGAAEAARAAIGAPLPPVERPARAAVVAAARAALGEAAFAAAWAEGEALTVEEAVAEALVEGPDRG